MSVSSTQSKQIYAGDGVTTQFSIPFPLADMVAGTDLAVYIANAAGVITKLNSGFTVNTGTMKVTYPNVGAPLPNDGSQIILNREEPLKQGLTLTDSGPFSPKSVETQLDMLTYIVQQLQEQLSRAVLLPINTPANATSPVIAPTSGILITHQDTYANLKVIAAAAPSTQFWGYATDQFQLYFYTGNPALGDAGFIAS